MEDIIINHIALAALFSGPRNWIRPLSPIVFPGLRTQAHLRDLHDTDGLGFYRNALLGYDGAAENVAMTCLRKRIKALRIEGVFPDVVLDVNTHAKNATELFGTRPYLDKNTVNDIARGVNKLVDAHTPMRGPHAIGCWLRAVLCEAGICEPGEQTLRARECCVCARVLAPQVHPDASFTAEPRDIIPELPEPPSDIDSFFTDEAAKRGKASATTTAVAVTAAGAAGSESAAESAPVPDEITNLFASMDDSPTIDTQSDDPVVDLLGKHFGELVTNSPSAATITGEGLGYASPVRAGIKRAGPEPVQPPTPLGLLTPDLRARLAALKIARGANGAAAAAAALGRAAGAAGAE